MGRIALVLVVSFLVLSNLACCVMPRLPTVEIHIPTLEVGEMKSKHETIELGNVDAVAVEIMFGTGELEIEAGTSDVLFSGDFRYNVSQWEPEIKYRDGVLTIRQGETDEQWGMPTGKARNEWELKFTPRVPLAMDINVGAGRGDLDLSGLQLTELEVSLGAGNCDLRFNEVNRAALETFTLESGASRVEVSGIGNASPRRMSVRGGVGDIVLDFTGAWTETAEIDIAAGVGAITLRLPDNVGVKVEAEGLSNINAPGFHLRDGRYYVNDAFGEAEVELHIKITAGVGNINLREVSNE
ncbi:MAG: toast rack family protein [Anaerolineae bacterium]|nr:toast rack family protein [Anaerolineae bacterium]